MMTARPAGIDAARRIVGRCGTCDTATNTLPCPVCTVAAAIRRREALEVVVTHLVGDEP